MTRYILPFLLSTFTLIPLSISLAPAPAAAQTNPPSPSVPTPSVVVWPVSGTTTPDAVDKPFGFRVLCGASCTNPPPDFHRGIDLKYARGTSVHAVFDGTVIRVNSGAALDPVLPRWGRFVVVALDDIVRADGVTLTDHKVAYLHLDSVTGGLAVGSPVTRGQVLGTIGDSGQNINTVHLHFDYYQGSSDAGIRRAEARSPLEILPHASIVPTVTLARVSDAVLRLTVRQDPDSLDVVAFILRHDGWSTFHGLDPIVLDFNEKVGINMAAPDFEDRSPFEGTTFRPKYFSRNSSAYQLELDFDGDWSSLTEAEVELLTAEDARLMFPFDF